MNRVRDRAWPKVVVATMLVVASLAMTEPSLFGLGLAVVVCFILIVVVACALFAVAKIIPMMSRSALSRSALAFFVFFALIRWVAFSQYLNGGTFYVGYRPYILNGSIQFAGYFYILAYSTILTVAVRLIERPIVPSS